MRWIRIRFARARLALFVISCLVDCWNLHFLRMLMSKYGQAWKTGEYEKEFGKLFRCVVCAG